MNAVLTKVLNWFKPEKVESSASFARISTMRDLRVGDLVTGMATKQNPTGEILPIIPRKVVNAVRVYGSYMVIEWGTSPSQMYEDSRLVLVESA